MLKPILYTFRRCPYAIRARLAIHASGVDVDMREVDLRNKPPAMLACSPKGTVPVLQLTDGKVLEESLDIMRWALAIQDPEGWIDPSAAWLAEALGLIGENDGSFKRTLDDYKYAGRPQPGFQPSSPRLAPEHYREQAGAFLQVLNARLERRPFLMGEYLSLPDVAILPFIRQFAQVDKKWFYKAHAGPLAIWHDRLLQSPRFVEIMQKRPAAAPLLEIFVAFPGEVR